MHCRPLAGGAHEDPVDGRPFAVLRQKVGPAVQASQHLRHARVTVTNVHVTEGGPGDPPEGGSVDR